MMKSKIRIGSRDSRLAIAQAEIIRNGIQRNHPELQTEIVTMKTTGDRILGKSLEAIGGKGLFVKELDMALRDGRIDLAVHSLKICQSLPVESGRIPETCWCIGRVLRFCRSLRW